MAGSGSEAVSKYAGIVAFIFARNFGTSVLISVASSSETVTKSKDLGRYSLSIFTRSGNSSRQGSHQVAQKFTSKGFVFSLASSPLRSSVLSGATTVGLAG